MKIVRPGNLRQVKVSIIQMDVIMELSNHSINRENHWLANFNGTRERGNKFHIQYNLKNPERNE